VSEIRTRLAVFLLAAQICGAAAYAQEAQEGKLAPGSFKAYAADGVEARVSDFSGLPVPRYSSLRYDRVNGRAGPSRDYPVEWTYERVGLPVVIVRESQDWRKVRDPMGDEVWVNKSQLAAERTAITVLDGEIRRSPDTKSGVVARFAAGVVMSLGECRAGWCGVEAEGRRGFARQDQLWGANPLPPAPLVR
jgi:SH3-like domain-containing protein